MADFEIVSNEDIQDFEQPLVPQEITRRHWLSNDKHPNCMTPTCRKTFTLFDRQHHCRMCGKIFCSSCINYRKRLNNLAHPDPQGELHQVCGVCFEFGKEDTVTTRDLMADFCMLKRYSRQELINSVERQASLKKTWRDKLDLERECERLVSGFQKCYGQSEVRRSLHEVKTVIKTPDWQKSSAWLQESMADKCQGCCQGFGLLRKRYSCKLCGQCRCKACCKKELLIYIPDQVMDESGDNSRNDESVGMAKLAIIKVIGSPEVEPEVSLLLHVCGRCHDYLTQRQISRAEEQHRLEVNSESPDIIGRLIRLDKGIAQIQAQISDQLTKFQEVVDSLDGPRAISPQPSGHQSNTKLLAKAQIDVADHLTSLFLKVEVVKSIAKAAQTPTQRKLCQNYLKSKCQFYINNKAAHSKVKSKLNDSQLLTPEVLNRIQNFVDEKAIVSAQVYVRQLVFETIFLCEKHKLQDYVPKLLTDLDMVVAEEACQCLTLAGENLEQHENHVRDIVRAQIKDRRLIKISTRQLAQNGQHHAADMMIKRTYSVLQQVKVQLEMKTLNRSFIKTKGNLDRACAAVKKLNVTDLCR